MSINKHSDTWATVEEHCKTQIKDYTEKLVNLPPGREADGQQYRGYIFAYQEILKLEEPHKPIEGETPSHY